VGTFLPEWAQVRDFAVRAEELGFDAYWANDHPLRAMDCWTQLAALATVTTRLRLIALVSCVYYRSPALIARQAADVDRIFAAGKVASLIGAGSFTIIATSPVLVTQGLDCEPSLSLGIAADAGALIKDLTFALLPNFDQLLAIVRPMDAADTAVYLDGMQLPDNMFRSAGAAFEVGEVSLAACPPASGVCTHHLTAASGFGLTMRGMDVQSSYALTAPALVGCDPSYEVCLN